MFLKIYVAVCFLLLASWQISAQSTAQKIQVAGERMLRRPYVAGVLNEQGTDRYCLIDTLDSTAGHLQSIASRGLCPQQKLTL